MASPRPKRVQVRIASPDTCPYTIQEQNRILRDSICNDSVSSFQNGTSEQDISTRNVLDALKEISRKRIQSELVSTLIYIYYDNLLLNLFVLI